MIICFEGTPGSGKSYEAIRKITDNLKLGRTIYTNIDGLDIQQNRESIKSFCGLSDYELETQLIFLPHFLVNEFWKHTKKGSLILIDEVHKWFSARDWASEKNKGFAEWASTHRHEGYDVVLITQKLEKVDSHVRSLIEWTYRYKKLNMFGSLVQQKYKRASFCGEDTTGKPLDNKLYTYDKRIFHCYKSFVSSDVKELGIMAHSNVLKHPVFYLIPISFLLFGYLFFKSDFVKKNLGLTPAVASVTSVKKESKAVIVEGPMVPAVPVINDVVRSEFPPSDLLPPPPIAKATSVVVAGINNIPAMPLSPVSCNLTMSGKTNGDMYEQYDCGSYNQMIVNGKEKYRVKK